MWLVKKTEEQYKRGCEERVKTVHMRVLQTSHLVRSKTLDCEPIRPSARITSL